MTAKWKTFNFFKIKSENFPAESQPNIKLFSQFAKDNGISEDFVKLCARINLLESDNIDTGRGSIFRFIDEDFGPNREFMDSIRGNLPTSVSGGQFMFDYNIRESQMKTLLEKGEAVPLAMDYESGFGICNIMLDKLNPSNKALIEKIKRLRPVPSAKYYKNHDFVINEKPQMVPVAYLAKLGFGDAKTLTKMVVNGRLPGTYTKTTKDGRNIYSAQVNITPYETSEMLLNDMRAANHNLTTTKAIAQKFDVRHSDVREWLQNGDIDIIPEYIFWNDYDNIFIDKTTPKNSEFFQELQQRKLLEKEIKKEEQISARAARAEELQAKRQENGNEFSLRMKIAWYLCPYTRELFKSEAHNNGQIGVIMAKEDNEEPLSQQEQITLNSYRKRVWETGHAKEAFSDASNRAIAIMQQYKTDGIESISDPEIVKIIENHNAPSNEEEN